MKKLLRVPLMLLYLLGVGAYVLPPEMYAACCESSDGKHKCCGDCCSAGATSCWAGGCT